MPLKTFLFYLSHPAQFLFARNVILRLQESGHKVHILIKSKDVMEKLVKESGLTYKVIQFKSAKKGKISNLKSLFERNKSLYKFLKENPADVLIGTDASVAQVGRFMGIKTITVLEDDYSVIKELALLTYPFTNHIVVPEVCDVGGFSKKKIGYPGYMKLAYLAPNLFKPDRRKVKLPNDPYFLLRLSALEAYHDSGMKGLNDQILREIIQNLESKGRVYISSEKELKSQFNEYRLELRAEDIHHYLYYSEIFISDSQSMTVEAALLGVPSVRYSDFVDKISVLNELEEFGLTFGVKPGDQKRLNKILNHLIAMDNRKALFAERRKKMLTQKIDVTSFFTWFLSEYPKSVKELESDPEVMKRFKFDEKVFGELF